MADVERFRAHHARRPRRLLRHHVDRTGRRAAGRVPARLAPAGSMAPRLAASRSLAGGSVDRLADQPAH